MLIDFENTGYISVCPSQEIVPVEDKNTYIPSSTWGYIRGDISKQSDLMDLLANIENGLTADQIGLLVNADDRLNTVEQDIAALETGHEFDFANLTAKLNTKANIVDVYTKSEIDSKHYLTEHQDLTDYATMSWVYGKNYLSQETDPIWNAEKHKYALKSELPSTAGYAKESWVNEQLLKKADMTDVYTKIEIEGKNFTTQNWVNEQLLAKVDASDVYTKIEIDGKDYASKNWTAEQLLGCAKLGDTYTKSEIDGFNFATEQWTEVELLSKANTSDVYTKTEIEAKEYITAPYLTEQLTAKADLTDVYTKIEIEGKNYATEDWTAEQLLAKANATDVYTKIEIKENLKLDGFLTSEDLVDYATQDWTIKQLSVKANATDVYTKIEMLSVLEGYLTVEDLNGYATEKWVLDKGYITEHQSLEDYYTKNEVDTAIANVEVDLTGYATETYVNTTVEAAVESKVDYSKIWTGTQEEWDALSADEQSSYIIAMIEIEL